MELLIGFGLRARLVELSGMIEDDPKLIVGERVAWLPDRISPADVVPARRRSA